LSYTYLTLNQYLRAIFGTRVQKIPLDAGLTCPNRDGTKARGGCIYCDSRGSGTGAYRDEKSVRQQMEEGIQWARRRYKARKFIAYFQSFSNTYAPPGQLEEMYRQALISPEVVGLFVGTRPDCVDKEVLSLISRVGEGRLLWMEYGLQSASDETLVRINRGHTVEDFVRAVEMSRMMDIPVCAHVIFGLPGETRQHMESTVQLLADLKVEGVKFHQLYVVRNSRLHQIYEEGGYNPMAQEEYAEMVAWAIAHLPENTVIQRLTGDPPLGGLVAPEWSSDKAGTISLIKRRLNRFARRK